MNIPIRWVWLYHKVLEYRYPKLTSEKLIHSRSLIFYVNYLFWYENHENTSTRVIRADRSGYWWKVKLKRDKGDRYYVYFVGKRLWRRLVSMEMLLKESEIFRNYILHFR